MLLIAALWTFAWLHLQAAERASIGAALHTTEQAAVSFEQYTRRAIKDADRMARLIKHEFEQHGTLDLDQYIRAGLVDSGGLVVVSVADAKGDIVARSQSAGSFNIADREFFKLHAERDAGLLDISKPVVGRVNSRSLILMSRRLNHPDGSFAGIVVLAVTPEYFTEFYDDAELGTQGSLGLLGLDGTFRARRVGGEATSVPDGSGAQLVARANLEPDGHYEARGDFDQVNRIVAYRKLPDYPFIVTTARATDEALADFYRNRNNYLLIASAATIVILVFFAVVTILAMRLQRHRGELKLQRRFLTTLLDNVPPGVAVRSMKSGTFGQYVLWNESNALVFGRKAEEALGKTITDVMPMTYATPIVELDRQLLASPMVQDFVQERDLPGKGRRIHHLIRAPIFGGDGQVEYIMTSTTDITEERRRTDELRLASKVFETIADAIVVSDADDRVIMVNAAFSRLTGHDAQEIVGTLMENSPFRRGETDQFDAAMEQLRREGFVTRETRRSHKDGSLLLLWVSASCVRNSEGAIVNYVRVYTDISLLKETQQKLERLASFDTLTGLPNRRLLQDRLEQALLRAKRHQVSMALLFIDLDEFKEVNDTLGHDVGDLLLQEVAVRLVTCIRSSDSLGRFGGDEFAIVLEDACLPVDAVRVGERIVTALAAPFDLNGHRVGTAASVGIAIYPLDGTDAASLLKNADVAMYKAKRSGRNLVRFFSDTDEAVVTVD